MTMKISFEDSVRLREFLLEKHAINWGLWGDSSKWIDLGIDYEMTSVCFPNRNGKVSKVPCTVIEFDEVVNINGAVGKRFGVGNIPRTSGVKYIPEIETPEIEEDEVA